MRVRCGKCKESLSLYRKPVKLLHCPLMGRNGWSEAASKGHIFAVRDADLNLICEYAKDGERLKGHLEQAS